MAESKIEWTDATWNPTTGCTRASAGCDNCYAFTMTKRLDGMGQEKYRGLTGKNHFNGVLKTHDDELSKPLRWKKPCMVFVNSMSDLFHKEVPFEFIDRALMTMAITKRHTFQILTKRPERMAEYFATRTLGDALASCRHRYFESSQYTEADSCVARYYSHEDRCADSGLKFLRDRPKQLPQAWPLPNVWLGTSVENVDATSRIDHLLECPAAVRFVSAEPLLARTDFAFRNWVEPHRRIDWCIVGGESGPNARPCNLQWIREIVEDCKLAGVACFVKQLGGFPVEGEPCTPPNGKPLYTVNNLIRLRDRKGGDMEEWPEDLRIRQFPHSTRIVKGEL